MKIATKNWKEFQHYKDRNPIWIKLHKKLLDDFDFQSLPLASKAVAPMLWLIASESVDGVIDADYQKLAFRLRMTEGEVEAAIGPLIGKGFFDVVEFEGEPQPATATAVREKAGFSSRYIGEGVRRLIWERDAGECKECGGTENLEIDHIIPISRGGSSDPDNLQLLCRPCNRRKRVRLGQSEQVATPDSAPAEQVAPNSPADSCASRSLEKRREETEKETEKSAGALQVSDLVADGVSEQAAKEFLRYRRVDKKATLTSRGWALIKGQAAKAGWGLDDAVSQIMARGWTGFEAAWVSRGGGSKNASVN